MQMEVHALDLLDRPVRNSARHIRIRLLDDLRRYGVLVVRQQRVQELHRVFHQVGGLLPVILHLGAGFRALAGVRHHLGLLPKEDARHLHHQPNAGRWILQRLHLHDVVLREEFQRLHGGVECGERLVEVACASSAMALASPPSRRLLLRQNLNLGLVSHGGVRGDHLDHLLHLHRRLLEHGLKLHELFLHHAHLLGGGLQLIETDLETLAHRLDLLSLLAKQTDERLQELEVRRGGDVVVPAEGVEELLRLSLDGLVDEHAALHDGGDEIGRLEGLCRLGQEGVGNGVERLERPLAEPVDGAAVDEEGNMRMRCLNSSLTGLIASTQCRLDRTW